MRKFVEVVRQKLGMQILVVTLLASTIAVTLGVFLTITSWASVSSIVGIVMSVMGLSAFGWILRQILTDYSYWSKQ